MSVAGYVAKFEGLSRFCPYINGEGAEVSKGVKFEIVLHLEIYQYVSILEIRDFDTLVNKWRIFDEAGKAKASYYMAVNEKKGRSDDRGKPYSKDKGKKKSFDVGYKWSGGDVRCCKCGGFGHYVNECKKGEACYKCCKAGHKSYECKSKEIECKSNILCSDVF